MQLHQPTPPVGLHVLAAGVLSRLRGQRAAENIVIGGGVALQHYCPHRPTVDLDAWWRDRARHETEVLLEQVLRSMAQERGLAYRRRAFGDTQSFELMQGDRKVFTVQIALRSVALDEPLPSAWAPVLIETFRDNLGAKMNALVGRGAPRDFTDVFEVCHRGLATTEDCWSFWQQKNADQNLGEAKARVLLHLEQIAARRPLAGLTDPAERERAGRLRVWVQRELCGRIP
ncbi:MAG: hypothetical protein FJ387_19840 [Verrucomicrobia bacterium]|nr:hypothetical protein [Verrucomicrobiota bacterium]